MEFAPSECICGKHLFVAVNDGTCWWCGYGDVKVRKRDHGRARTPRLPRDLGALQREGRRPDPYADNVVRLDRLPNAVSLMREAA